MELSRILFIEPFYGGSHKQLIDLLHTAYPNSELYTLPGKKWHWRARVSALHFAQALPHSDIYGVLFGSSVLNLAELVALRPDLSCLKKILYFHENQLVYPVRKQLDRDFQYGYNQILSCLVADIILFNSKYNMDSFLSSIDTFLKLIPDHRPKGLADQIQSKCQVLYFPLVWPDTASQGGSAFLVRHSDAMSESNRIYEDECDKDGNNLNHLNKVPTPTEDCDTSSEKIHAVVHSCCQHTQESVNSFTEICHTCNIKDKTCTEFIPPHICADSSCVPQTPHSNHKAVVDDEVTEKVKRSRPLHIVWSHRWEHDKGPEEFFRVLFRLHEEGLQFSLSVVGESYREVPDIFEDAKRKLSSHIIDWGYAENREKYLEILQQADVSVSTAKHEFYGVAMIESVLCGCYPICPNRLVYPEIFPGDCLYNTDNQLFKKLRGWCQKPVVIREKQIEFGLERFLWKNLKGDYKKILGNECCG